MIKLLKAFKGASLKMKGIVIGFALIVCLAVGSITYGTISYFKEMRTNTLFAGLDAIAQQNYSLAAILLTQSGEAGDVRALEFLAWLEACRGNYDKSFTAASEASAKGSKSALEVMGDLALLGVGPVTGAVAAVSYFNQLVDSKHLSYDDKNAALSELLDRALPLARNRTDYLDLVLAGMDYNSPSAYLHLGDILFLGDGLTVNTTEAVSLWQIARERGIKQAATRLAGVYWHGYSVEPDRKQAYELYEEAANNGDPVANYSLGLIALRQDGARPAGTAMRERAEFFFKEASREDYAPADVILGILCLRDDPKGTGLDRALNWFADASRRGDTSGTILYALMQAAGVGCEKNTDAALVLLYDESALGSEIAAKVLEALSKGEDPLLILEQALTLAERIMFGDIVIKEGAAEAQLYHDGKEHAVNYYHKQGNINLIDPKIYQIDGKYLIVPSIGGVLMQSEPSTGARLFAFTGQNPRPQPPALPEGYKGQPVTYIEPFIDTGSRVFPAPQPQPNSSVLPE